MSMGEGSGSPFGSTTRYCDQPREIFVDSFPERHVSGDDLGLQDFHGFSNHGESDQTKTDHIRIHVLREAASKILASSPGDYGFPDTARARIETSDEKPSNSASSEVVWRRGKYSGEVEQGLPQRSSLMVKRCTTGEGQASCIQSPRPLLLFRRFRRGLGRSSGQECSVRKVVSPGETPFHQHEGAEGCSPQSASLSPGVGGT